MTHSWLIPLRGCELPSPNSRMNRWARARLTHEARELAAMVSLSERNRQGVPVATDRRAVTLTMLIPTRRRMMDDDNCQAMLKPIRDSLQRPRPRHPGSGWIVDDSAEWADVSYGPQRVDARGPAVEVTVSEP